jgi:hypothetical protein
MSTITKSILQQNEDRGNSKYDDRNSKSDITGKNTIKQERRQQKGAIILLAMKNSIQDETNLSNM